MKHQIDKKGGMCVTYIALIGFSGSISVAKGEIIEIKDKAIIDDLTKAGYIAPIDETATIIDKNKKYREYK